MPVIYQGRVFSVEVERRRFPNGQEHEVEIVRHAASVVLIPIDEDGRVVIVKQYRAPLDREIWEFPAGQIDDSEEPDAIRATGLRELREEAGYELAPGGEVQGLGHFFPSCGFTDEHSHLLVARPVVPHAHGQELDAHEAITECRAFSIEELRAMIASGEVRDANTLAAFARLLALRIIAV